MKIVFAISEITPYASTGGLADVGAALPVALQGQGLDIVRVMPMYRRVLEDDHAHTDTGLRLHVPVGLRTLQAEVWQSVDPGPPTYFIRKDEFFDRRELYSLPERDYDDNFERFVFFQKAVVALMDQLQFRADIVHANDWETGLIPYFLDHGIHGVGRGRTEKVVYTIHNLAYQGIFPDSEFPYSNLPYSCFSLEELEFYGNINCMKGGIVRADVLTTVSKRYAQEILTPEFGCGLEGVLSDARDKLHGIMNGVDYSAWDPSTDHLIAAPYSAENLSGKKTCRKAAIERLGLEASSGTERAPVIGMVSRLVDQKGMDLLSEAMDRIMSKDVYFLLLGSGQEEYQEMCLEWAVKWPERFGVYLGYNNALAHQIEAGADLFMMPSKFEPCGLNQLYSLRYGTIPIVHATGGLDDSIRDLSEDATTGNGFKFREYSVPALMTAVERALVAYRDKKKWAALQKRVMQEEYSWDRSAREYIGLYESLLT